MRYEVRGTRDKGRTTSGEGREMGFWQLVMG
jgi:hypothetical protein